MLDLYSEPLSSVKPSAEPLSQQNTEKSGRAFDNPEDGITHSIALLGPSRMLKHAMERIPTNTPNRTDMFIDMKDQENQLILTFKKLEPDQKCSCVLVDKLFKSTFSPHKPFSGNICSGLNQAKLMFVEVYLNMMPAVKQTVTQCLLSSLRCLLTIYRYIFQCGDTSYNWWSSKCADVSVFVRGRIFDTVTVFLLSSSQGWSTKKRKWRDRGRGRGSVREEKKLWEADRNTGIDS